MINATVTELSEALAARKENKPADSAVGMARKMGIELLTEQHPVARSSPRPWLQPTLDAGLALLNIAAGSSNFGEFLFNQTG